MRKYISISIFFITYNQCLFFSGKIDTTLLTLDFYSRTVTDISKYVLRTTIIVVLLLFSTTIKHFISPES